MYFDIGTPSGTYSITSAIVYDKAGNYTHYSPAELAALQLTTSFTVASNTPADLANPVLVSSAFSDVRITPSGAIVTFAAGALDTGTGVDRVYFNFDHAWEGQGGPESVVGFADAANSFSDGVSTKSVYFGPSTAAGTYSLVSAFVYDRAGNYAEYSASELHDLGIQTSFTVRHAHAAHNDFNGDGRSDILWRSDAGTVRDWLGQANGAFAGNTANLNTTVPSDWHIVGTGDFNGDGLIDVLWRNDAGTVRDWLGQANGGFAGNTANLNTPYRSDWHIVGTGDFNGDGISDILWRNDAGTVADWLGQANGGFAGNTANLDTTVPTDWHIAGTGDFNGDGIDDILWRNDGGDGPRLARPGERRLCRQHRQPQHHRCHRLAHRRHRRLQRRRASATSCGATTTAPCATGSASRTAASPGTPPTSTRHSAPTGTSSASATSTATPSTTCCAQQQRHRHQLARPGQRRIRRQRANLNVAVPTDWHVVDPFVHDPFGMA